MWHGPLQFPALPVIPVDFSLFSAKHPMPGTLSTRQYDIIISDIDGCLSPESSTPFDVANLAKIAEHNVLALERGDRPMLTVCSGRPQPFAEAMCRLLQNTMLPCVCENGAWLYHPGTNVYTLDPAITKAHLQAVHDLSAWCFDTFGPSGVTQQPGKTASVTLFHPDTAYLKTLVAKVEAQCTLAGWPFRVSMTWFYINCDLAFVNKGTGLARLAQSIRYDKARTVGIGDTVADKYIADFSGFFACPANAQAGIKEHAHFIAASPESAGVVEILHRVSSER